MPRDPVEVALEKALPAPPRPMLGVAMALVAGLAIGLNLGGAWWIWMLVAALPLLATAWLLWSSRRIHGPEPPTGMLLPIAVIGLGGLLGANLTHADRRALAALPGWAEGHVTRVSGRLAEEPRRRGRLFELVLEGATLAEPFPAGRQARAAGRFAVRVPAAALPALPLPGQAVSATGRFLRTDASQTSPSPFNAWRYWRSRGIFGQIFADAAQLGPRPTGPWAATLAALRAARMWLDSGLARRLSGQPLALARALLLGETGQIAATDKEAFARVGLSHLLAVSGLHTGFILLLIGALARVAGFSPRGVAWVCIFGVILYAGLTGFRPPVMRAATMSIFILFGFAIGRWGNPLASLAVAAFFTLVANPRNLLRLDWQLSYGCALSIILFAPAFYELFTTTDRAAIRMPGVQTQNPALSLWRRWAYAWIVLPFSVVLAVQLGLAPLQLFYFQQLNLLAFINLVAVPLTMLAAWGAAATAVFGHLPFLGAVGLPTAYLLRGLLAMVRALGTQDWAVIAMAAPPLWLIATYYAVLLTMPALRTGLGFGRVLGRRQRVRLVLHACGCALLLAIAPLAMGSSADGSLDFYAVDVGQGDGLVVRFPNGRIMVIDAGPGHPVDQGKRTMAPFLRSLGVLRIDCLVASHADADHIGGLADLLREFPVGTLLTGPDVSSSETYRDFVEAEHASRAKEIAARQGESLAGFGHVAVRLLGPVPGETDNNGSVVLLLDDGDVQILATGDLEAEGERRLIAAGYAREADVLKVGHHGSRSSSSEAFLEVVRPKVALVSVGARNRYGHPAPEVLDRLRRLGTRIERTDQLGTLWVRTDGHWLETYRFIAPD